MFILLAKPMQYVVCHPFHNLDGTHTLGACFAHLITFELISMF